MNSKKKENISDVQPKQTKKKLSVKKILLGIFSLIMIFILLVCFYIWKILDIPIMAEVPIVTGGEIKDGILDKLADPESETASAVAAKPQYWGSGRVKLYVDSKFPIIKVDQINKNVENILVIGLDSRSAYEKQARTDSVMVVSVDKLNNSISLMSFMRDIQVIIPGRTIPCKINSAYVFGGIGLLINTLNTNFGLDIQKFAMVDMLSSENIIEATGGVDINIKINEVKQVNENMILTNRLFSKISTAAHNLTQPGLQHLNGRQAVSYGRIRYVGNDQGRTLRQRTILSALMLSFKQSSISRKMKVFETICESFETNITKDDMLFLAIDVLNGINNIKQYRVPEDGMFLTNTSNWQIIIDMPVQLPAIQKFIWGDNLISNSSSDISSDSGNNSYESSSFVSSDLSPPITPETSSQSQNSYSTESGSIVNSSQNSEQRSVG